jgi:hypothetical protein
MGPQVVTRQGRSPLDRAARRIRFLMLAAGKGKALRRRSFDAALEGVERVHLPPLDRLYVENQLTAAAVYVVEVPGYHGYAPGAGLWHLRQALARLLSAAVA